MVFGIVLTWGLSECFTNTFKVGSITSNISCDKAGFILKCCIFSFWIKKINSIVVSCLAGKVIALVSKLVRQDRDII